MWYVQIQGFIYMYILYKTLFKEESKKAIGAKYCILNYCLSLVALQGNHVVRGTNLCNANIVRDWTKSLNSRGVEGESPFPTRRIGDHAWL